MGPQGPLLHDQNDSSGLLKGRENFLQQLNCLEELTITQLIRLVQDASQPGNTDNTDKQVEVLTCAMKRLLGGHEPHKQQV